MDYRARAERFFRGIWSCDPTVITELAANEIVISYPVFETIFGTPAVRGREAVRRLVADFCQTWADPAVTVHQVVAEANRVVLVWSFRARDVGVRPGGQPASGQIHSWGGISLFSFDDHGMIVSETGEESRPGPAARVGW